MATSAPEFLYLLDEDLYRLGNATSPRLNNVKPQDVSVSVMTMDGYRALLSELVLHCERTRKI
jgi:hypothetical protein